MMNKYKKYFFINSLFREILPPLKIIIGMNNSKYHGKHCRSENNTLDKFVHINNNGITNSILFQLQCYNAI